MCDQQLDLFSSAGIQAERPPRQSMELRPPATALDAPALYPPLDGSVPVNFTTVSVPSGSTGLSDGQHWVRRLPGKLLHNIISHGIAKLAEFLGDDLIEIVATAHQSEQLKNLGAPEVLDELRVLIRDKRGTTAFFCFSTQIKGLNELRIYGPANSVTVDIATGSLTRKQSHAYKSYLTYFIPPLKNAREHLRNAGCNVINFLRRRRYQDFGMKELIERFYNSIRLRGEPPIPYREIILTSRIMDEIFSQIHCDSERQPGDRRQAPGSIKQKEANVSLVTSH